MVKVWKNKLFYFLRNGCIDTVLWDLLQRGGSASQTAPYSLCSALQALWVLVKSSALDREQGAIQDALGSLLTPHSLTVPLHSCQNPNLCHFVGGSSYCNYLHYGRPSPPLFIYPSFVLSLLFADVSLSLCSSSSPFHSLSPSLPFSLSLWVFHISLHSIFCFLL